MHTRRSSPSMRVTRANDTSTPGTTTRDDITSEETPDLKAASVENTASNTRPVPDQGQPNIWFTMTPMLIDDSFFMSAEELAHVATALATASAHAANNDGTAPKEQAAESEDAYADMPPLVEDPTQAATPHTTPSTPPRPATPLLPVTPPAPPTVEQIKIRKANEWRELLIGHEGSTYLAKDGLNIDNYPWKYNRDTRAFDVCTVESDIVLFSTIVMLSGDRGFFMAPDGGFSDKSPGVFERHRQSAIGVPPPVAVLKEDYTRTIKRLQAIANKVIRGDLRETRGMFQYPPDTGIPDLKFTRSIFEPIQGEQEQPIGPTAPEEMTLDNLPTSNAFAAMALQDLKNRDPATHKVRPFQCFNYKGASISPTSIPRELRDETVIVYYNLHCFNINGSHVLHADIQGLRVIGLPRPTPKARQQRFQQDPFSPRKKAKREV
ncbi:hypothetical protein NM688_g9437 [Phlebia brevispora]|uniref:Uncharacterized protein n=1 Tax=Phlebia brevispora TaxID=194682 RepID=A0ACC1RJ97_9APHY|nr:hypothetical protein NM688_g9437 [Phlebia brevispora]